MITKPQREWRYRTLHRNREIVEAAKKWPCVDCGGVFPAYVMDFDHVRGVKNFLLQRSQLANRSSEAVLAEIAKCDLVCANCHRIRTFSGNEYERVGYVA